MTERQIHRLSGLVEKSSDPDLVGMTWASSVEIEWPPHGMVSFIVPAGWKLLLQAGKSHLQRADATRTLLPSLLIPVRSPNPSPVRAWLDETKLLAFLRDALAGVLLCHSALDNWSADMIPDGLQLEVGGSLRTRSGLVRCGLEWRLTKVAAAWSGRPNLAASNDSLLQRALELKTLRDELEHVQSRTLYTAATAEQAIFVRLLRMPALSDLVTAAEQVMEHYKPGSGAH